MESTELVSDLIKIGIPSIVALAGTFSSLLLAWWGHRQSLQINTLLHQQSKEKERHARTGELVKHSALELNSLHDDFVAFGNILFAKIDTHRCNDPWPEAEQNLIQERFQKALLSLHKHAAAKSYVMLLGCDDLTKLYQNYLDSVGVVIQIYAQNQILLPAQFDQYMNHARHLQMSIVKKMSDVYLIR